MAEPFPISTAAAHVAPLSVERRVQTWPFPPRAVAPVYSATRFPAASLASAVVDDVSHVTPLNGVARIVRVHDVPPFVVRQISMSIAPVCCWLPG